MPPILLSFWKHGSCRSNRYLGGDFTSLKVMPKGSISEGFIGDLMLNPRSPTTRQQMVPLSGHISVTKGNVEAD
jgi:hypothetical protein